MGRWDVCCSLVTLSGTDHNSNSCLFTWDNAVRGSVPWTILSHDILILALANLDRRLTLSMPDVFFSMWD